MNEKVLFWIKYYFALGNQIVKYENKNLKAIADCIRTLDAGIFGVITVE